jgi:hypothetical protein
MKLNGGGSGGNKEGRWWWQQGGAAVATRRRGAVTVMCHWWVWLCLCSSMMVRLRNDLGLNFRISRTIREGQ